MQNFTTVIQGLKVVLYHTYLKFENMVSIRVSLFFFPNQNLRVSGRTETDHAFILFCLNFKLLGFPFLLNFKDFKIKILLKKTVQICFRDSQNNFIFYAAFEKATIFLTTDDDKRETSLTIDVVKEVLLDLLIL